MGIREKIEKILNGKVFIACMGDDEIVESRKIFDDLINELEMAFEEFAEEKECINCISNRGF